MSPPRWVQYSLIHILLEIKNWKVEKPAGNEAIDRYTSTSIGVARRDEYILFQSCIYCYLCL